MDKSHKQIAEWVTEIQAIAQSGLAYSNNEFDRQRYEALTALASQMMSELSDISFEKIHSLFIAEKGYATPKLDVRAFIVKDERLLMVKEVSDGLWTLPGGWADVNESPSEAITREVKEETGFDISIDRLLALWDKHKHDHPPQWPHAYKCFFSGKILSGQPTINIEVSDIDFFDVNTLPPLSVNRVTKSQIIKLAKILENYPLTAFD